MTTIMREIILHYREIDECCQMIENLFKIGEGLLETQKISEPGILISSKFNYDESIISKVSKEMNLECFYGRAVGFQVIRNYRKKIVDH